MKSAPSVVPYYCTLYWRFLAFRLKNTYVKTKQRTSQYYSTSNAERISIYRRLLCMKTGKLCYTTILPTYNILLYVKDESMCTKFVSKVSTLVIFLYFQRRFIMYSADFMGRGRGRNQEMSTTKNLRDWKGLRTFSQVHDTSTRICVKRCRAKLYVFWCDQLSWLYYYFLRSRKKCVVVSIINFFVFLHLIVSWKQCA